MNLDHYNNLVALNYSGAKILLRSPGHYKAWLTEEKKDTPAFQVGRLVHLAALQPELLAERVAVAPIVDRRTKDGKASYEAFQAGLKEGQECVSADVYDDVIRISKAAHEALVDLGLTDWQTEMGCVSGLGNITLKGRPDLIAKDANGDLVVVDLKTTQDASPAAFAKDVANFKYHLQAAFYMRLTGAKKFVILAQEKELPCANRVYTLDEAALAEGNRLMEEAIALYSQCVAFDSWPTYTKDITTLSLPKWAISTNQ
jgi:exodeoxyribonuclease VIII